MIDLTNAIDICGDVFVEIRVFANHHEFRSPIFATEENKNDLIDEKLCEILQRLGNPKKYKVVISSNDEEQYFDINL